MLGRSREDHDLTGVGAFPAVELGEGLLLDLGLVDLDQDGRDGEGLGAGRVGNEIKDAAIPIIGASGVHAHVLAADPALGSQDLHERRAVDRGTQLWGTRHRARRTLHLGKNRVMRIGSRWPVGYVDIVLIESAHLLPTPAPGPARILYVVWPP